MSVMRRSGLSAAVLACTILAAAGIPGGVQAAAGRSAAARLSGSAWPSGSARPSAAADTGRGWLLATLTGSPVPGSPVPGRNMPGVAGAASELDGVFCASAANCWADGYVTRGTVTVGVMLHWNGRTWRAVRVPNPAGTRAHDSNELFAVRCLDARDCWAVGDDSRDGKATYGEALHWNGGNWSSVATPRPGGSKPSDVTEIADATCTAAKSCWAVGEDGSNSGLKEVIRNLALHWNGKRWSQVRVANPAGSSPGHYNTLSAVRCVSPDNCLAVGGVGTPPDSLTYNARNEALRWNGKRWSLQTSPDPGGTASGADSQLVTLACGAATSCWAGGYYGSNVPTLTVENQILHWTGRKWTKAVTPEPDGTAVGAINYVIGATCTSSKNCWAVGTYGNSVEAVLNQALHWNGKKWSLVTAPNPAGTSKSAVNVLISVRCPSAASCWAVGAFQKPGGHMQNEILYWHGKKWSAR